MSGYTGLTVGGVLSVGGCPLSNDEGAVVDRVRELTVVTGTGDLVRCSPTANRDLFDAALGGLGQCGIIVRALLDLVPAKPMARTYLLHYLGGARFSRSRPETTRRRLRLTLLLYQHHPAAMDEEEQRRAPGGRGSRGHGRQQRRDCIRLRIL